MIIRVIIPEINSGIYEFLHTNLVVLKFFPPINSKYLIIWWSKNLINLSYTSKTQKIRILGKSYVPDPFLIHHDDKSKYVDGWLLDDFPSAYLYNIIF